MRQCGRLPSPHPAAPISVPTRQGGARHSVGHTGRVHAAAATSNGIGNLDTLLPTEVHIQGKRITFLRFPNALGKWISSESRVDSVLFHLSH